MSKTLIDVTRDAAALPELERLKLARIILDLSASSTMPVEDAETAWDDEITRRLRELRTGGVKGVPLAQVKWRIEAGCINTAEDHLPTRTSQTALWVASCRRMLSWTLARPVSLPRASRGQGLNSAAPAAYSVRMKSPAATTHMSHMFRRWTRVCAALAAAALGLSDARAANWAHWRGPQFNGASEETGLPTDFSKTNGVKWATELPGPAAATPVVWGDTVFVSSTDRATKTLVAMAFDRRRGTPLWRREVGSAGGDSDFGKFAAPSPVTDGEVAVFLYGTGELAAFDFAGKKLWARNLQQDYGAWCYQWTYGASPTLFDGRLYVLVLQRDVPVHGRGRVDGPNESYLLALAPATGKELWRHIRPTEADAESKEAYSTPIPVTHDGTTELLITGGDCISGHEPATGRELWRWGSWNRARVDHWRLVPSPVVGEGRALVCAPKGGAVFAVKSGVNGALDDSALAWKSEPKNATTDVATPLYYRGRLYVLNGERHRLTRLVPATGAVDWVGELGGRAKIEASPTAADGKIYVQDFRGEVFVLDAGEKFQVLKTVSLGEEGDDTIRSSIPVSQGNLFIRTNRKLYCVGK